MKCYIGSIFNFTLGPLFDLLKYYCERGNKKIRWEMAFGSPPPCSGEISCSKITTGLMS
jgi:hypothetical protein